MTTDVDCIVVGAGVIGLAVARSLARSGRDVVVLEAAPAIGTGTSSRNSEVIHAGLYYPPGSLKARLCVSGRELLYEYCRERGVAHRKISKLVVAATDKDLQELEGIAARAEANGVNDLRYLEADSAKALEPALSVSAALLSPSTGIIDSHAFMLSLQGEAEDHGALIAFGTPVVGGAIENGTVLLRTGGDQPAEIRARLAVNAAGLSAHSIARSIDGVDARTVPGIRYAKGNYFGLRGKVPFSRLIYPVPEPGGLGVHLTLDLAGSARFGPDVEWVEQPCYEVAADRARPFYQAIRRYWPGLPDNSLYPDYAGIRVKIEGQQPPDFMIEASNTSLINLFGFESPGLTAALAIARHVEGLAAQFI